MPAGVRRERRGYEKIECVDIDKRCCFFLSDIWYLPADSGIFIVSVLTAGRRAAGWHYFLVCVFLFPWRHGSERKAGRKKIFVGALSRNLVLCHFSCRFHDTEPGSIHKNPGRFPCIISLRIRWHVRRHDTGRQKVNLAELKCCLVSMQRKSA